MITEIVFKRDPQVQAVLKDGLRAEELRAFPGLPHEDQDQFAAVYHRDDNGAVVGGVEGMIYWDGLEVEVLWVDPHLRRQGIAQTCLSQLEEVARERGAGVAFLKTYEARGFYETCGYAVFGVLEGRPAGSRLYHMSKRLGVMGRFGG